MIKNKKKNWQCTENKKSGKLCLEISFESMHRVQDFYFLQLKVVNVSPLLFIQMLLGPV